MNPKIWPGIRGIRKLLQNDKPGWHVWVDSNYLGFFPYFTIKDAIHHFYGSRGCKLSDVTGNGLSFSTTDPNEVPA